MRSFVLSAVAASFLLFSNSSFAGQADRVCAGGCDRYGNPVYNVQPDFVEDRFDDERYVPDEEFYNPRIDTPPPLPRYVDRGYRNRYKHTHRRYRKKNHTRRYNRRVYRDRYAGRTEFCREHIERRGQGWGSKKVKVRRCIWVRNDLVPNYAEGGYVRGGRYSDDW